MNFNGTTCINEKGHLEIGGCDTVVLAREFGTPLYVIDEQCFRQNCRDYYDSFVHNHGSDVLYAAKTLLNLSICRIVFEEGLGLDVVSGGELYTAIQADFPVERICFHGNNKSILEITMGLEAGVGRFMVDNIHELIKLNDLAESMGKKASVLLRLTPGVEAHTHEYIKTGQIDSKFGLVIENSQAMSGIKSAIALKNIELKGIHCHIGSQIFDLDPYTYTGEVMTSFIHTVYKETGYLLEELNLGGGLGIYYAAGDRPPTIREYADVIVGAVQDYSAKYGFPAPKVIVEPGRSISGPAGTTLYTVGAVKDIPGVRKYVAVDGGMGDNPRPALYRSRYEACLANKVDQEAEDVVSIAGKYCESGDMIIWDIALPDPNPGDILAIAGTGSYNYSMSMNYNRIPRPAMVIVSRGQADLITRRESYEDLLRNDVLPERLGI